MTDWYFNDTRWTLFKVCSDGERQRASVSTAVRFSLEGDTNLLSNQTTKKVTKATKVTHTFEEAEIVFALTAYGSHHSPRDSPAN